MLPTNDSKSFHGDLAQTANMYICFTTEGLKKKNVIRQLFTQTEYTIKIKGTASTNPTLLPLLCNN